MLARAASGVRVRGCLRACPGTLLEVAIPARVPRAGIGDPAQSPLRLGWRDQIRLKLSSLSSSNRLA